MRDWNLLLSEFPSVTITDCKIVKRVNSHGRVTLQAFVDSDIESELLLSIMSQKSMTLQAFSEKQDKKILFVGLPERYHVKVSGQLKILNLVLIGSTISLDLQQRNRSFQNTSITYETIFQSIKSNYPKMYVNLSNDKPTGRLIVQYQETDWEFGKRMASHLNTCIIPYFKSDGVRLSIGVQEENEQINIIAPEAETQYRFYEEKTESEKDASMIMIKSREIYDLGDRVLYNGKTYYIYQIFSKMSHAELIHTYSLRAKAGFYESEESNLLLPGVSLDGSILAVAGSMVKVHLQIDPSQAVSTAKWFPYSTVYSSPDGGGWYCMPEIGDRIRLYFPNEKEDEAYVISSIHLPVPADDKNDSTQAAGANSGGGAGSSAPKPPPRSVPDNKSLMNKFNKQVELTPTSIIVTNNAGMSITIDDETGINIVSNKDITIQSEQDMTIKSLTENLKLDAEESIELNQGDTQINLKDDIKINGAKVFLQ